MYEVNFEHRLLDFRVYVCGYRQLHRGKTLQVLKIISKQYKKLGAFDDNGDVAVSFEELKKGKILKQENMLFSPEDRESDTRIQVFGMQRQGHKWKNFSTFVNQTEFSQGDEVGFLEQITSCCPLGEFFRTDFIYPLIAFKEIWGEETECSADVRLSVKHQTNLLSRRLTNFTNTGVNNETRLKNQTDAIHMFLKPESRDLADLKTFLNFLKEHTKTDSVSVALDKAQKKFLDTNMVCLAGDIFKVTLIAGKKTFTLSIFPRKQRKGLPKPIALKPRPFITTNIYELLDVEMLVPYNDDSNPSASASAAATVAIDDEENPQRELKENSKEQGDQKEGENQAFSGESVNTTCKGKVSNIEDFQDLGQDIKKNAEDVDEVSRMADKARNFLKKILVSGSETDALGLQTLQGNFQYRERLLKMMEKCRTAKSFTSVQTDLLVLVRELVEENFNYAWILGPLKTARDSKAHSKHVKWLMTHLGIEEEVDSISALLGARNESRVQEGKTLITKGLVVLQATRVEKDKKLQEAVSQLENMKKVNYKERAKMKKLLSLKRQKVEISSVNERFLSKYGVEYQEAFQK
jgi:hypothetical protein